jgi:hypothetical protein
MSDPDLPGYFPEPIRAPEPPGGFPPPHEPAKPQQERRGQRSSFAARLPLASLTRAGVVIMGMAVAVAVILVIVLLIQDH